jgi:ABC-type phosphate transport system substrate-binding protein
MLRLGRVALLICAIAACCSTASARDVAIVVHKGNSIRSIPLATLIRMCKGQQRKWPDNRDLTVIMRQPAAPEMKLVLRKIFGATPEETNQLINAANQTRREHPVILLVESDDVLVKAVETNPGAIGLVDVYSITGGINVVKVDGKSPLEPGYVLHGN